MLRSSQTFHFRPNHQMASLPSRTDALLPEFFLCLTSLIGLSSWVIATSHLLGRDVFTLTNTRMVLHGLVCRPNPRYGASSGSRTHTTSLEDWSTSRYTIPAFYRFSCVSYIYIILKFSRKVKFLEGSPRIELG